MATKPKGKAPVQLMNPHEEDLGYLPDALIYGHSGTGKTGLSSTAPAPLILDFEDGAPITVRAVGNPDARVIRVDSMSTVREVYAWLRSGEHEFQTVVIDPLGELQTLVMLDTMERHPAKRSFNRVPSMQDWGLATEDFGKLFYAFRLLPMHVIFVAHAQSRQHDEDVVAPMLQGKRMAQYAMRQVDLLAYLRTELNDDDETVRVLQTSSSENITAKNRGGVLEPYITDPNMTDIFNTMKQNPGRVAAEKEE